MFVRYVLRAPTSWAFDISYMMYGALFFMAGAYALSRNGHVRGDFLYRAVAAARRRPWSISCSTSCSSSPACWRWSMPAMAWRHSRGGYGEVSVYSPAGIPVYPMQDADADRPACCWCCRAWSRSAAASCACATGAGRRGCTTSRSWRISLEQHQAEVAAEPAMTDPQIGVLHAGAVHRPRSSWAFPIAFTLMALAFGFGFYAMECRIISLLVTNTFECMSNDVLVAVPLFLFMGYIVERANILDRLFRCIQVAAKGVPGSLAVATLVTCALFATATGIVGAVVTLMGLLALSGHAARRLRTQALGRRHLRRRHAGHPDPALDHADRLRRRRQRLGGPALCRGDASRASCWPACTWSTSSIRAMMNPALGAEAAEGADRCAARPGRSGTC